MEEPKQDSGNLTPIEKYKELQKQDWQLEGLIVTSIIYGLFQIPELLQNNMSWFLDFVPSTEIVFAWFRILGLAAIVLISNLLLLIMYRLIWIIVAFSPNTDYDRLQRLNDLSGLHLSFGFRWFLFLVTSSWVTLLFYGTLDYLTGLNGVLLKVVLIPIYFLFPFSLMLSSLRLMNLNLSKATCKLSGFIQLLFCIFNPLLILLLTFKNNKFLSALGLNYNLDLLNYAEVRAGSGKLSVEQSEHRLKLFPAAFDGLLLAMISMFILISFSKKELRKDTDLIQVMQNENYLLFTVDQSLGLNESKNFFILPSDKKSPPQKKLNLSQLGVTVNGKKKAVNWLWNRGEADFGIHAYVNHQDLDSGVNIIRIKFGKYQEELEFYRAK
ncbi:MAG: hypothetical protein RLZZ68_1491 [Bacteroidota bacterium]|jgi:hypothetical protein|nr:hypothetical protein [Flavobacteriia bacterium]NBP27999.1 hypothetical protein [Flavobacteriia bacterium]